MILGFLIGVKEVFQAEGRKIKSNVPLKSIFFQRIFFSENKIIVFLDSIKLNISVGLSDGSLGSSYGFFFFHMGSFFFIDGKIEQICCL